MCDSLNGPPAFCPNMPLGSSWFSFVRSLFPLPSLLIYIDLFVDSPLHFPHFGIRLDDDSLLYWPGLRLTQDPVHFAWLLLCLLKHFSEVGSFYYLPVYLYNAYWT